MPRDCEKCVFTKLVRYENCVIFWNNCSFYIIIKSSSSSPCLWAAHDMLLLMAWHNPLKYIVTFISHRHFGWNNFPGFFSCTLSCVVYSLECFWYAYDCHILSFMWNLCVCLWLLPFCDSDSGCCHRNYFYTFLWVFWKNRNTFLLAVKRIFSRRELCAWPTKFHIWSTSLHPVKW